MQPLHGIKVVEMATFLAAPSCARFLADMGAEVIKVEPPEGETVRFLSVGEGRPPGDIENTTFDLENANKSSICLDIKSRQGREAMERLIAAADVFITNVRAKSLVKLGLDYEALKVKYPKLVVGTVTGYGEKGPARDLPGFDFTAYFARGGIMGTLYNKGESPILPTAGFGDHPVGMYLTCGILAALYRARETGRGDKVTVSLFHGGIWAVAVMLQSRQYGKEASNRPKSRKESPSPLVMAYETQDERWIQFAAPDYNAWYNAFVTAVGREDLIGNSRYYPHTNVQTHLEEFYTLVKDTIAQKDCNYWREAFRKADIPYAVGQTWDELLVDEQAWANDCFYKMEYPTGASRTLVRPPVMFMDTPLPEYKRGPYQGEQTEEILARLGYSQEQIKAMMLAGDALCVPPREK